MTSTVESTLLITKTFIFYNSIFILITGLLGNCFNVILFTTLRTLRDKPCGYYFLVESIVNLCQILFGVIAFIIERRFDNNLSTNSMIWCKIKTTIIQSLHLIFLSTVSLAAVDQFLSTHYFNRLRQLSTKQFARKLLLYSQCIMIIHFVLSMIYFEVDSKSYGCIIYQSIVSRYYSFFFYPILNCLLPMFIAILFSLLAFYNVRHLIRRQIPIQRRQLERQLTAMTFARIIAFIVLVIPFFAYRIYSFQPENTSQNAINSLIGAIAGFLAFLNYVISFYVFLIASARFRRQVRQLILRKGWRTLKQWYQRKRQSINHRNQTAPETDAPSISTIRLG